MSGKKRYGRAISSLASRKENKPLYFSGQLGITTNGEAQVEVPSRSGFVWVRLRNQLNEVIQAFNETVSTVYDLPVLVKWDEFSPNRYKIVGRDVGRYSDWGSESSYLPIHGAQHQFNTLTGAGGGDIVWVYSQQFQPLLVTPSGTAGAFSVSIQPHVYYWDSEFQYAGGTGIAGFDGLWPTGSSNARMLLVYLDPDTGNVNLATGSLTEFSATLTGTADVIPYVPALIAPEDIPLAAVRLVTGTATIQWPNLYDIRTYFASAGGAYGGSGAPANAQYVTMALNGTLSDERVLTAGADIDVADGGAGGNATVSVETGTFSRPGHTHAGVAGVNELPIYEDHVFVATGTILDFGENVNVEATGTVVFVSTVDTQGGGGTDLLLYDSSVFKVTGNAISFDDNLAVHVTGSIAYVVGQAGGGAGGFPIISEDSVFKATGVAIDFGENMNVAVTGTTVFVSSVDTQGGGGDLLIYDDSSFKVTGTALDFGDNISVDVTGSIAYISSTMSEHGFDVGARVYNSTGIVISDSTPTNLTFNSERYDTNNIHSTVSNTSRLTCQTAGKYIICGTIEWESNAANTRQIAIWLNGTTNIAMHRNESPGAPMRQAIATVYELNVEDYVELRIYQDSGDDLDIILTLNASPEFAMQKIDGGKPSNTIQIYDDSVFKATGIAISFDDNLDVVATGSSVFVNATGAGGYTEGARIYNSTGISIDNITATPLTFDSERYDTDGIHSGSSSQLYCNTTGKYMIVGNVQWDGNTAGSRILIIRLNGTTIIGQVRNPGEDYDTQQNVSTIYELSIGDYVELDVYHDRGSNLSVEASPNRSPEFMMQRIG